MKLWTAPLLILGAGAVVGLIAWSDAARVWTLFQGGGLALLLVPIFHLGLMLANALGWRALLRAQGMAPPLWRLWWFRWLADSINALLPVVQVGGEVARGRLVAGQGVPGAKAAASVIVDLTLGVTTLVVFILAGLALATVSGSGGIAPLAVGTVAFGGLIALFYRLQRSRWPLRLARFLEERFGGPTWAVLAGGASTLDGELGALYRRPAVLARSAGWWLVAWTGGAAESLLAILILGQTIGPRDALIFEAVTQAFRNAGFAIPGALGVQEGGMMVAGAMIGLPPDMALTVSLVKRMRDLTLGLPALLIGFQGLAPGRDQGV